MWYDVYDMYRNGPKQTWDRGQVISLHFLSMRVHWPWHLAGANECVQNLPRQLSMHSHSSQIYAKDNKKIWQSVKIEALDTLIAKQGTKSERKWKRKNHGISAICWITFLDYNLITISIREALMQ